MFAADVVELLSVCAYGAFRRIVGMRRGITPRNFHETILQLLCINLLSLIYPRLASRPFPTLHLHIGVFFTTYGLYELNTRYTRAISERFRDAA